MFTKLLPKKFLIENYLLLFVLLGTALVAFSIGPYQNGDTQWEYQATMGVLKWGIPYTEVWGSLMNQPPLGFYLNAFAFKVVGSSIPSATVLMTLFSIASTFLLYKLGKTLYSKSTGLVAAALFALTPWELSLSRTFLIDAQCLFFSLLSLYIGIHAIRRSSLVLSLLSGGFFACALLTKNFAVFILIPLALFYFLDRQKDKKKVLQLTAAFGFFALFLTFLWYQVILGRGLMQIFRNGDFHDVNYAGVIVTPTFLPRFLWDYGLGAFLVMAVVLSVLLPFGFKKHFGNLPQVDVIFIATILPVLVIDLAMGVVFNLKVPYTSAVKYDYQALPFFCLIAASLVPKCASLLKSKTKELRISDKVVFSVFLASLFLIGLTFVWDVYTANQMASSNYIVYQVTADQTNVGYSFFRYTSPSQYSFLLDLQYAGFVALLAGLLLATWRRLVGFSQILFNSVFGPMQNWIDAKKLDFDRRR